MKLRYIVLMLLFQGLLVADIDFSKHQIDKGETLFAVTNVAMNDVLNVREKPTSKSAIRYKLSSHAQNIISYEENMVDKVGKNIWVSIRVGLSDGYVNGFVNAKYLRFAQVFDRLKHRGLSLKIPYFMEYEIRESKPDWIYVFHSLNKHYYSGCDERDNPELLHRLMDFEIALKVYETLSEALMNTVLIDSQNFSDYYDSTGDWFRPNVKGLVEKVNYHSLEGYRYQMGVEGCGEMVYFFKRKGKVLVIKESFDYNPPILPKGERLPKNWKFNDKKEILNYIIKHIEIKPVLNKQNF